ncbi:hypothetical protein F4781DRAFT_181269 [Annulohypoxylon bovei var. microspora]|nr:hypothetical protein F4781DRAFT_181269 [Annulohypoxylon bovei var. microspora]
MAHPRCPAYSPARALHRVLVSGLPTTSPSLGRQTAYYLLPPRLFSSSRLLAKRHTLTATASSPTPPHVRPLSTTPALRRIISFRQRIINDKIPYTWVRVAGSGPENTLSPPQPTARVLASLDLQTHTLVMVAPPPSPSPSPESSPDSPAILAPPAAICRVINNAEARAAEAEASLAQRRKAVDTKELELSWSITPHDLSHKLRKMREFLSKGLTVEVVLAKKRRGRAATKEEAAAVLVAVRDAAAQVEGAKEYRKMDGEVGGMAKVFLEGPSQKKRRQKKELEAAAEEEEEEEEGYKEG